MDRAGNKVLADCSSCGTLEDAVRDFLKIEIAGFDLRLSVNVDSLKSLVFRVNSDFI